MHIFGQKSKIFKIFKKKIFTIPKDLPKGNFEDKNFFLSGNIFGQQSQKLVYYYGGVLNRGPPL